MQRKMNIINMQFGTQQSASWLSSQSSSSQQNEFYPKDKIRQYLFRLLSASKQQSRIESVRRLINQQTLPILNIFIQHYLFGFYSTEAQLNPIMKRCGIDIKQEKTKWEKFFSLKYYALLEKQKLQKQKIQKLQRKLSQSILYAQHIKQKSQDYQKSLKIRIQELSELKKLNEDTLSRMMKDKIIKQLCENSNFYVNSFNLNSLVYKNPKEIIFSIDHYAKTEQDQSQVQNVFYRTCYQLCNNDCQKGIKMKNLHSNNCKNSNFLHKSSCKGFTKTNYPKTAHQNRRKGQTRKSFDKWSINNKTQSIMNISEKEKENLGEGLIVMEKQLSCRENKGNSKDSPLKDIKNIQP